MAKKKKELLPFPRLLEKPEACLGCGYPLEGIPAPGACPECGMEFYDRFSGIQIAGVAKRSAGPTWRRVVWVIMAVVAFLYGNLVALLFINSPIIALVILAALIAGVVGMALTSPSKKGIGSELFTFVQDGFSRWPVGVSPAVREFRAWDGVNPCVFVKPVSRVWGSIKIVQFDERGKREVVLSGGFRCRTEQLPLVEQSIEILMRGESICDDEGLFEQLLEGMNNPADDGFA